MPRAMFTLSMLILLSCFVYAQETPEKPQPQPNPPRALPQSEAELDKRLDERTTIEITENQTFGDLLTMLRDKAGIQSKVDPKGAGELGITTSSPVVREPVTLIDIPLRAILRQILREQDLTYRLDGEVLVVTSEEEAKRLMKARFYPVADLVTRKGSADMKPHDYILSLMDIIEATVSPDSWDEGGQIIEFGNELLVIRQTDEVHAELKTFFEELRSKLAEIDKAAKSEPQ